jgi:Holliday junction DNA helicase RuvA
MFEYLKGKITDLTPTYAVVETGDIGYHIHISLHTFTHIKELTEVRLYIHHVIREDAHLLFGFFDPAERMLFRQLVSVSGIGANTARLILSSMSPDDLRQTIATENVAVLQGIKGIGTKTAQRVIVDLRDKVGKIPETGEILQVQDNSRLEESLSALVTLGFPRARVKKVVEKIIAGDPSVAVEDIVKEALKIL